MTSAIGFVVITHSEPDQILFLCQQLTARFDEPPIVIHHDFSKCSLDKERFPRNVTFVEDWNTTRWGGWGVVDGLLKALKILYRDTGPDWFVCLSGTDYPIKSCRQILHDLNSGDYDVYLDNRRIEYCMLPFPEDDWGDQNFIHPAWVRLAFERYMAIGFGFYRIATRLKWKTKAIYLRSNFFISRFTPFDGTLDCYAGDFWLTANRKAAGVLLEDSPSNRRLREHFRKRPNPDEGFFQTELCNSRGLKISTDNKRYADWTGCFNHPRTLEESDFASLIATPDHFARKFGFNPQAMERLNLLIDSTESSAAAARAEDSTHQRQFR